jgi:uncharacterized heparinase superfamily protein
MFNKFKLYANTLKYLKLSQLYWQLRYRIYRSKKIETVPFVKTKQFEVPTVQWINKKSFIRESETELINIKKSYQLPTLWSDKSGDDLWFFNVHYFDYINNSEVDDKLKYKLVNNWIDSVSCSSAGWQAYPASLRIINWIKWIIKNEITDPKILQSLYSQCCHLDENIEYHILANHLFSNIKAMLIAGLFFDSAKSSRWIKKYTAMLLRELKVQILENGGHYELSPMYHNICLEDLLDIISFKTAYSKTINHFLITTAKKMLEWSGAMTHPDGEVSFFNDSASGIAATVSELKNFARTLGIDAHAQPKIINDCDGYYVVKKDLWDLKFDAADVMANHQPGHTHADALSFELSVGPQRFFVNSGISTYHDLKNRSFQRSTPAHNTIVIDGLNTSQVWSKFRVAKRASIIERSCRVSGDDIILKASHDGYKHLTPPVFLTREILLNKKRVVISDNLEGSGEHQIEIFFYLHPDVSVKPQGATILLSLNNIQLLVQSDSDYEIKDSFYYPAFNTSIKNKVISFRKIVSANFIHKVSIEMISN